MAHNYQGAWQSEYFSLRFGKLEAIPRSWWIPSNHQYPPQWTCRPCLTVILWLTHTLYRSKYLLHCQGNGKLSQEQALPTQYLWVNLSLSCASVTLLQLLGLPHQIHSQTVTSDSVISFWVAFEVIIFETWSNSQKFQHVSYLPIHPKTNFYE